MKAKRYLELEAKVVQAGTTWKEIAKELGIENSTLHRKRIGESEFTIKEARGIRTSLNLTADELVDIFFNH